MTLDTKKISFSLKDLIALLVFVSTILWNYFSFKNDIAIMQANITSININITSINDKIEKQNKKIDKVDRFLLAKYGDQYEFVNKIAETKRLRGMHINTKN